MKKTIATVLLLLAPFTVVAEGQYSPRYTVDDGMPFINCGPYGFQQNGPYSAEELLCDQIEFMDGDSEQCWNESDAKDARIKELQDELALTKMSAARKIKALKAKSRHGKK